MHACAPPRTPSVAATTTCAVASFPRAPVVQCWQANVVRELAKFLPFKRPPLAPWAQTEDVNIEVRGPGPAARHRPRMPTHDVRFTCEISSVTSREKVSFFVQIYGRPSSTLSTHTGAKCSVRRDAYEDDSGGRAVFCSNLRPPVEHLEHSHGREVLGLAHEPWAFLGF